jgi:hypothetical protein
VDVAHECEKILVALDALAFAHCDKVLDESYSRVLFDHPSDTMDNG